MPKKNMAKEKQEPQDKKQPNRYIEMGLSHYDTSGKEGWFIEQLDKLGDYWKKFMDMHDISLIEGKDFFVNKRNLCEVIQRIDKRAAYYFVFHRNKEICEYKWAGICAYWINTLKPFTVVKETSNLYSCPNEMFSLFLIICVVRQVFEKLKNDNPEQFEGKTFQYLSDSEINDIIYYFKYCDLSRESMLLFVEMFARSCGVGMDMLPPDKLDQYE